MTESWDGGVGLEASQGATHNLELEQDVEHRCGRSRGRARRSKGWAMGDGVDHGKDDSGVEVGRWDEVSSPRRLVIPVSAMEVSPTLG